MKCPKCDYLGFETGDRCKNCGYDFSLLAKRDLEPGELSLKASEAEDVAIGDLWLGAAGPENGSPQPDTSKPEEAFPLFTPGGDEPLIKAPSEPRAPLAVRRAPELPRSRMIRAPRPVHAGFTLEFAEDSAAVATLAPDAPLPVSTLSPQVRSASISRTETAVAGLGSRALAAAIDHVILFAIDLFVVYATLRMMALTMDDWRALPPLPLLGFLLLMKFGYFSAFTAMGGQTIGKMAAGIRVVADDELRLDPARAIKRTLSGAVSLATFGLGLIPALLGPDRRAFHDRVAHTRVVDLPSA